MGDNELYNIKDVIDYHIFKTISNVNAELYKELYQVGYLGYLKAQKKYDAKYGKMSLTYAGKYISKEVQRYMGKEYKYMNKKADLTDMPEDITEQPYTEEQLQKVKDYIKRLPEKESSIVYNVYLASTPAKQTELAKRYNLSPQRISAIKLETLKKIREILDD